MELLVTIGPGDLSQTVLVLIPVGVHRRSQMHEVVSGLLVLDAEMTGAVYLGCEQHVALVPQGPIDNHCVVLVWFEEPFLMRG
jgi:hypothetical protein